MVLPFVCKQSVGYLAVANTNRNEIGCKCVTSLNCCTADMKKCRLFLKRSSLPSNRGRKRRYICDIDLHNSLLFLKAGDSQVNLAVVIAAASLTVFCVTLASGFSVMVIVCRKK